MTIDEAVAVQRKLLAATQTQFDNETDEKKRVALHNRIKSFYTAIACMLISQGTNIDTVLEQHLAKVQA